jgi:hypothetical protein
MVLVVMSGGLSDDTSSKTSKAPGAAGVVIDSVATTPLLSRVVFAPPAKEGEKPPWKVSP